MDSIIGLGRAVQSLSPAARKRFDSFFAVEVASGRLVVPETMQDWVAKTFGSVEAVSEQPIVKVLNKRTFEGALFNGLRASRPMHNDRPVRHDELMALASQEPFGSVGRQTPEDVFGRVVGRSEMTASNVAKYDAWHGVVVFNRADPLAFTESEVVDHFETSLSWIRAAHAEDGAAEFPAVVWNCLWKAGASLVHGHMQTLLSRKQHYAGAESLWRATREYKSRVKRRYWTEFLKAHESLGLGKKVDGVSVVAHLTPKKEKEVLLWADRPDRELFSKVFKVLVAFKQLGVESFNVALVLPPLRSKWPGFPALVRVVDRGSLSAKTTDVGVMELLLGHAVVSSDPVRVWDAVKKVL